LKTNHYISACILALLDWASKWWIVHHIGPTDEIVLIPGFFQIILAKNPGIAFGFFQEGESLLKVIVFSSISILGLIFLLFFGHKITSENRSSKVCLTLILGGITGNLGDRLYNGFVVDFLDVFWRYYHWPTFNLADSYITVGVLLLAWTELLRPGTSIPPASPE
jgi:signal peptidase II